MAAPPKPTTGTGAGQASTTADAPSSAHSHTQPPASSPPIEMSDLEASKTTGAGSQGLLGSVPIPTTSPIDDSFPTTSAMPENPTENTRTDQTSSAAIASTDTSTDPTASISTASQPAIQRLDSVAIGPSTDATPAVPAESGPVVVITLLLTSGARHPYKIDERYLTKRNVNVPGVTENGKKDPYSISVYTLKELILREWREEWEAQPSSPSSIRLIYFGRLLDDKTPLKECRFNTDSANVVHMTVRPQDIVDEEDASKSKALGRDREGTENTAGCRCVIL